MSHNPAGFCRIPQRVSRAAWMMGLQPDREHIAENLA
jgi:hypothetical protein